MSAADCIAQIKKKAPYWSDDDIDLIVTEFQKKRQRMKADPKIETAEEEFLQYARQIGDEIVWAARMQKKHKLQNIKARRHIKNLIDKADEMTGDPSLAFEAANVGINAPIEGGRLSVDARGQALANQYLGGFIADLKKGDLFDYYNNKRNHADIQREMWELSLREGGEPGKTGKPQALAAARVIHKYQKAAVARLNRAGAAIGHVDGFITSHAHDRTKIRKAAFDQWRDDIVKELDLERTYPDAEDINKALEGAFYVLTTGRTLNRAATEPGTVKFSGPGNRAKTLSQHRTLHFKDADAEMRYMKKYGAMGFKEAVANSMEKAARETALMETWGPNPVAMFDNALSAARDRYRSDKKKLARLNRQLLQSQMRVVDGSIYTEGNPSWAAFGSGTRAVISMAKLGGAVVSAISDVALKASQLRFQGRGFLDSYSKAFTTFIDGVAPGDRRRVADLIGVGLDGQIGDLAARFSAQDGIQGGIAKMQRAFFKLNLLTPWTDANSRGMGLLMARDAAMDKTLDWGQLPERKRMIMSQYGIGEKEWTVARAAVRKEGDSPEYLMPDAFTEGNPNVEAIIRQTYGIADGRSVARRADELETKFRTYYADQVRTAVPMPGARETAYTTQGYASGTVAGETMRFMMQFKAFPTFMLTRVLGQRIHGTGGKADLVGLAEMILATTAMGYVAMVAKDFVKGRNPRDPSDPKTWVAAMSQGGGLGIYGDFIFGEFNRFGGGFLGTLGGPMAGNLDAIGRLYSDAKEGKASASQAIRVVINNTPGINLFYTRAVLDYLILYPMYEHLNPGYLRRYERRVRKENNQTFWLPPSEAR